MPLRLSSVFKPYLMKYRDVLLASGIKEVSFQRQMNYFDRFARENNIEIIEFTKAHSSKLYTFMPEQGEVTRYIRIGWAIKFLLYLRSNGYDVYIPRLPKYTGTKQQAYIYTQEELNKYFDNIDHYYDDKDPFVALYLPVIFRILLSSGTRIGETLSLKVSDVDLDNGILKLKETKNKKERYIVVSDEMRKLLNLYADKCLFLKKNDDYFFSRKNGKRIDEQSIYRYHRKALSDSDIRYIGGGKGPRLHDFRHTFAVNSLSNFEKEGYDIYNVLPILSQYLGHSHIASTERYLRLVMEHYDEVILKTEKTTAYINGDNSND